MHYPFWYVPGLTSPMWIAIVAVLHVYTAMYAVGGSILLASQTGIAYKLGDKDYLKYLHNHTWFFVLITLVYGSLFGVGIWWSIGLASPLATEDLIHIFVLGWAMEYVTFIIEILSAFIFFYYWGRLAQRTHLQMGWIYAGAAFGSLFIITAITAFQLNTGNWSPKLGFWAAFFNPQAFPQIASRFGGSLLLGALYFFLHSTLKLGDNEPLRDRVGKESAKWAMIGAFLTILGGISWYVYLPPSGSAALVGAAVLNVLMSIIFVLTAGVVVMMYVGPIRNSKWLTPGFAILFFGAGLAATGTGEFIREAVRKPYIVYGRVLGSQIRPEEIPKLRQTGYLNGGVWTSAYIKDTIPEVVVNDRIDNKRLLLLSPAKRIEVGRTIFQYHCNNCHATEGYSAVAQLSRGWNRELISYSIKHLDRVHFFMPPWAGTDEEVEVLTDYVLSIRHPYPPGLSVGMQEERK
jgi:cytochrome bd-type quinol oxidase subunit 1